jgi:hypothetical protein
MDEAEEQHHKRTDSPNKDDRKRKAMWMTLPSYF